MSPSGLPIGELARRTGLSPDSLRHYERLGLLPKVARSPGGARRFPEQAEHEVRVIQTALRIGFSLKELAEVRLERRRGGAPCRRVYALASAKLAAMEAQLRELKQLRDALEATLAGWRTRLAETAPGSRAGLLEALAEALVPPRRPTQFPSRSVPP
jgi:MerR family copper efflux transcriptional regulator